MAPLTSTSVPSRVSESTPTSSCLAETTASSRRSARIASKLGRESAAHSESTKKSQKLPVRAKRAPPSPINFDLQIPQGNCEKLVDGSRRQVVELSDGPVGLTRTLNNEEAGGNNSSQAEKKNDAVSAGLETEGQDKLRDADEEHSAVGEDTATAHAADVIDESETRQEAGARGPTSPTCSQTRQSPTAAPAPTPPKANATKIIFDDDYDFAAATTETRLGAAVGHATLPPADDGHEDNEEAPEAQDVHQVPSKVDLVKAALRAAAEQAASKKRKRQERDVLFKKQSKERKRATMVAAAASEPATTETTTDRKRQKCFDKTNIPDILPLEFLVDSDDDLESGLASPATKRPRKITFEDAEKAEDKWMQTRAMDKRVGDTLFRVSRQLGAADLRLQPKMGKVRFWETKEALMKRGRRVGLGAKRKRSFLKR